MVRQMLRLVLGVAVSLALGSFVGGKAIAEEGEKKAEQTKVTGVVTVEKNDKGEVTSVKIGDQKLVLDDKAKEIAEKAAGKNVRARGTLDADKNLKVEEYKVVEEKKKPEGKKTE